MRRTKIVLVLLSLMLMCLPIALAGNTGTYRQVKLNTAFDLKAGFGNLTDPYTGATCTLDLTDPSGNLDLNDGAMTDLTDGYYNYTYTYDELGTFRGTVSCTGDNNVAWLPMIIDVVTDTTEDLLTDVAKQANVTQILENTDLETGNVFTNLSTKLDALNFSADLSELNTTLNQMNTTLDTQINEVASETETALSLSSSPFWTTFKSKMLEVMKSLQRVWAT
jgi:hypothetical protein